MLILRYVRIMLVALSAGAAAACSSTPPPETRLSPPDPALTRACAPLPDIPVADGDVRVRSKYYAETRGAYGDCAGRHRGLAAWARVASGQPAPKQP